MRYEAIDGERIPYTAEREAEKQAEDAAETARIADAAYIEKRQSEYPPIGDQLDAVAKLLQGLVAAVGRDKVSPDALAVIDQVFAVKAKYPKPAEK